MTDFTCKLRKFLLEFCGFLISFFFGNEYLKLKLFWRLIKIKKCINSNWQKRHLLEFFKVKLLERDSRTNLERDNNNFLFIYHKPMNFSTISIDFMFKPRWKQINIEFSSIMHNSSMAHSYKYTKKI